jgi:hypothetical protein
MDDLDDSALQPRHFVRTPTAPTPTRIFSSYKYFRTCDFTRVSSSLPVLSWHLLFPLCCLPQFGKEIYLLSLKALRDSTTLRIGRSDGSGPTGIPNWDPYGKGGSWYLGDSKSWASHLEVQLPRPPKLKLRPAPASAPNANPAHQSTTPAHVHDSHTIPQPGEQPTIPNLNLTSTPPHHPAPQVAGPGHVPRSTNKMSIQYLLNSSGHGPST